MFRFCTDCLPIGVFTNKIRQKLPIIQSFALNVNATIQVRHKCDSTGSRIVYKK